MAASDDTLANMDKQIEASLTWNGLEIADQNIDLAQSIWMYIAYFLRYM